MKYDYPNRTVWEKGDPRKLIVDWDSKMFREVYNNIMPKYQPVISKPQNIINHPRHPFLQYVRGITLDIGCGNGSILASLKNLGRINLGVGIDISDKMITNAKKTAENIGVSLTFIRTSLEKFKPPSFKFDTIIVYDVLEHLFSVTKAVSKIDGMLSETGFLIGTSPQGRFCDGRKNNEKVHLHYFDTEDDLYLLFSPFFQNIQIIDKKLPEERRYYWKCGK